MFYSEIKIRLPSIIRNLVNCRNECLVVLMCIHPELIMNQRAESGDTNLNIIGSNSKRISKLFNKVELFVVVCLTHTARGIQQEVNVSFASTLAVCGDNSSYHSIIIECVCLRMEKLPM